MRQTLNLPHCLAVLRACRKRPRTARELQRLTGMSRSSVFRTLADLREQLRCEITAEADGFVIADTGLIDTRRL